MNKLIIIEGTDCSGKAMQSKMLVKALNELGYKSYYYAFPNYETPTGKIIGLPFLGKPELWEELIHKQTNAIKNELKAIYQKKGESINEELVDKAISLVTEKMSVGWFPEKAPNVSPEISSAYFAIDRAYNKENFEKLLEDGIVVMDRYIYSNMGQNGGKKATKEERLAFFEWIYQLETSMFGLRDGDIKILLHMDPVYSSMLNDLRTEKRDENENSKAYSINAEKTYLEVADRYNFDIVECVNTPNGVPSIEDIKTPEEIHKTVLDVVTRQLKR